MILTKFQQHHKQFLIPTYLYRLTGAVWLAYVYKKVLSVFKNNVCNIFYVGLQNLYFVLTDVERVTSRTV